MNRRKFAYSWGRKVFFGLSWPLSVLLGLVYLRSFIIPKDAVDVIYFVLNISGHFGLLNTLAYFLLFYPVVSIMPSYYTTRLWSLFIILILNLVILADAICFSTYHLHLYSYIWNVFLTEGWEYLVNSDLKQILIGAGTVAVASVIWVRGETFWRSMQTRFSNPIKNWYIALIVIMVIVSKLMVFQGMVHPKLAGILPLDFNYSPISSGTPSPNLKAYYPRGEVLCTGKKNPNVILITIHRWHEDQLTEEAMPNLFHLQDHSVKYTSHINTGIGEGVGYFSLMYSLPGNYQNLSMIRGPYINEVLEKRNYEMTELSNHDEVIQWIGARNEKVNPFFMVFQTTAREADDAIQKMILALQPDDLLRETHILIIGLQDVAGKVPFLYSSPERNSGVVDSLTTHYDVMPTLMENLWDCKNAFSATGTGKPLNQKNENWYLVANENRYTIYDLRSSGEIEVKDGRMNTSGSPRKELTFEALKIMNRFFKP